MKDIWVPGIFLHKKKELTKNPFTGESRAAYNYPFWGVTYTDKTKPEVLEQEKAEFCFYTFTFPVTVPLNLISARFRLWQEVWSRAIQIRFKGRHLQDTYGIEMDYEVEILRQAGGIYRHKAYRIQKKYTYEDVVQKLKEALKDKLEIKEN